MFITASSSVPLTALETTICATHRLTTFALTKPPVAEALSNTSRQPAELSFPPFPCSSTQLIS
jgi:hypothetical protein